MLNSPSTKPGVLGGVVSVGSWFASASLLSMPKADVMPISPMPVWLATSGVSGVGGARELAGPLYDGDRFMLNMLRGVATGFVTRPELEADDVRRINLAVSVILLRSTAVLGTPEPQDRAGEMDNGAGRLLRREAMSMGGGDLRW